MLIEHTDLTCEERKILKINNDCKKCIRINDVDEIYKDCKIGGSLRKTRDMSKPMTIMVECIMGETDIDIKKYEGDDKVMPIIGRVLENTLMDST